MNTLANNVFTDCICLHLTGKITDDILLVNKHYNAVVKADMKHLHSLFWRTEEGPSKIPCGGTYKYIYKDGEKEGEQLIWHENGQLNSKEFYKEGKFEGEKLTWWNNGQLCCKWFFKEGKKDGEQLTWHCNGQLWCKEFYKGQRRVKN